MVVAQTIPRQTTPVTRGLSGLSRQTKTQLDHTNWLRRGWIENAQDFWTFGNPTPTFVNDLPFQVMVPRSSWEPSLTKSPNGELIMMFFGNITNPPPVGSDTCDMRHQVGVSSYNLTTTNTYITISQSGKWKTKYYVLNMYRKIIVILFIPISQAVPLAHGLSQLWLRAWKMIPPEEILCGILEDCLIFQVHRGWS